MNSRTDPVTTTLIIEKPTASGASLAGIASVAALKNPRSYAGYHQAPYYNRAGGS